METYPLNEIIEPEALTKQAIELLGSPANWDDLKSKIDHILAKPNLPSPTGELSVGINLILEFSSKDGQVTLTKLRLKESSELSARDHS
jgi:hypothetical protein